MREQNDSVVKIADKSGFFFNADESGLFFGASQDKTLTYKWWKDGFI